MKRVWRKSSEIGKQLDLTILSTKPIQPFLTPILSTRGAAYSQMLSRTECGNDSAESRFTWPNLSTLFVDKFSSDELVVKTYMRKQVAVLKNELLKNRDDPDKVEKVCEEKGAPLFRKYSDGSAIVELFIQFTSSPELALQVFDWRRKQVDYAAPTTTEEYAKGITLAGRLKNVDLAAEYFAEATNKSLKSTSTYNALMGAYMFNGLAAKSLSLYRTLKEEATCSPTIVTYNILISLFGRLMLVDHMEETLQEIRNSNLSPDVKTYNNLIAGYITAWMWTSMEKTYMIMKADNVKPNLDTHLLMLRGYAHSRNKLEKMEETYELIKDHVNAKEIPLIRAMISAYCSSTVSYRLERIEQLLLLIPENEYRPWLNVVLICVYAREDMIEKMKDLISEAFEHNTSVKSVSLICCIIACYFRNGSADDLASFVSRSESSGWRICRSLYHCKMVMYGSEQRLMEMERVVDEMDMLNLRIVKKTMWILYKAYYKCGQTSKVELVMGKMLKHGYTTPLYEYSS